MSETRRTADDLVAFAYAELRAIARRHLAREANGHVLQPTALVHEAYLRLRGLDAIVWRGRTHFLTVAAGQMRRILVEHARRAAASKRGGRPTRVTLNESRAAVPAPSVDLLALDESLRSLGDRYPRQAAVAEMRLFSGMSVEEISRSFRVSDRTVKEDWRFAKAWIARDLDAGHGDAP
jgi:RNA polymerase sigma factor (TIGR02999 family)